MYVIVATKEGQRFPNKDQWGCSEDEIVRFGLLQDRYNRSGREISMRGITSYKQTTTVKIVDLNIDEEFYMELIKDSLELEYNIKVDEKGIFIITERQVKQRFNLKEIVVDLLYNASKKKLDVVYRIDGRILQEDVVIEKKTKVRTNRSRNAKNAQEEK